MEWRRRIYDQPRGNNEHGRTAHHRRTPACNRRPLACRARRPGHGGRRARRSARRARLHRAGGERRPDLRRARGVLRAGAVPRTARPLLRRSQQGRHRADHGLGGRRHVPRRLGRMPARLAGPDLRRGVGELRPAAARPYQRGHLRLRRQRADRHLLPRSPAHVAGAAAGPVQPVVRAASATTCSA